MAPDRIITEVTSMPILVRGKLRSSTVSCVRETVVGAPLELIEQIREFYTEVIGLKPWGQRRQIPGAWGLGDQRCGLLLQFRHDPEIDVMKRRFTVIVGELRSLEKRLIELEWPHQRIRGFGWTDQCILLRDPTGHLIEARQSQTL